MRNFGTNIYKIGVLTIGIYPSVPVRTGLFVSHFLRFSVLVLVSILFLIFPAEKAGQAVYFSIRTSFGRW